MCKTKFICFSIVLVILLSSNASTFAIARHSTDSPAQTPPNSVVGRWSTNASFVVVAHCWILTTKHQGGSPTTVTIDDILYNCHYNSQWEGGGTENNADIRLIKLTNAEGTQANLKFASPYSSTDEITQEIVIGGYGIGILAELYSSNIHYGYSLSSAGGNSTLRWCRNLIEGSGGQSDSSGRYSDILFSYFDGPNTSTIVEYEGMPTLWDSGGGWFINHDGTWKVAALNRGVETHGTYYECWFKNKSTFVNDPDFFDGIRISSYADWINQTIIDNTLTIKGDLTNDGRVDMADLALLKSEWGKLATPENNWCNGADINKDSLVDEADLAVQTQNWLCNAS